MALPQTQPGLGTRIVFDRSELEIREGLIWSRIAAQALIVGRAPRSVLPSTGKRIVITSKVIELRHDRIWTACSRCEDMNPLEKTGLRSMPNGDLRNQPQCTSCRHLGPAPVAKPLAVVSPIRRRPSPSRIFLRNYASSSSEVRPTARLEGQDRDFRY